METKISGVIITFNEEENIERCIQSLQEVCDEILVVDSFSTDSTPEIVTRLGARLIQNKWTGFLNQKNFAQAQAANHMVLQLDADEELSEALKSSILEVKKNLNQDGYSFNRFTKFLGKWIKHSGWYPDTKLRLYDRRKGKWSGLDPHPEVLMKDGRISHIQGDLLHHSFKTASEFIQQSANYAFQSAHAMYALNKPFNWSKVLVSPIFRFIKDFVVRGGIRDGFEGLLICVANGYYTFLKYMYLRQLYKGKQI